MSESRAAAGLLAAVSFCAALSATAVTAADLESICKGMLKDGRSASKTMDECLCYMQIAEETLDADVLVLLQDTWLTGTNHSAEIVMLKPKRRVVRQLRKMNSRVARKCWTRGGRTP